MARRDEPVDWVSRAADEAIRHAGEGNLVTCASGISPSGPIHLGNLREFLTVHFVVEEVRRRGVPVRHVHSWDDYDRFRKVPHGVDPAWNEHVGRPLSAVPDPWGEYPSWAERFKAPLRAALAELGCAMEEISQTAMYTSGAYREQILTAVRRRREIDAVLGRYRTKDPTPSEAAEEEAERFPFKAYCRSCGRDTTAVTSYDDGSTELGYRCAVCGFEGTTTLATDDEGKLVWKVDWPMRWAFERVDFEPAGADHSSPGSSFTVGHELVETIWDWPRPAWFGYSFVGIAGMAKMSSSRGGVPTPSEALEVLEAPVLRWLYVRRQPRQAFTIDFGPEVVRLYDEWDALGRKAADPAKRDVAVLAFERASATSTAGALPTPEVLVPFRTLHAAADITTGDEAQISRVVGDLGFEHTSVAQLEPRLRRAVTWTSEFVPAADRTVVREAPDRVRLAELSDREAEWLRLLVGGLATARDLEPLTALVYGVPKLARGLPLDAAPTDEVRADQKELFRLLYRLLVGADRGPRLPTLILAVGVDRVRDLLGG